MLVLTRRSGQAVAIGDDIEVVVVEVRGDQVRLGIRAPQNVAIRRQDAPGHADTEPAEPEVS